MNIQLIEGEFNAQDALELITQMLQVKVKFHENKIGKSEAEEDIKRREAKIKRLQNDLHEIRTLMSTSEQRVKINTLMNIEV